MANIEHCSPPHILTPLHPPLISSLPHSLTPSSLLPHPRAHILPSHPHYFTSLVLTPSQPPLILSLHHILATSHPPLISLTTCTCSSVTLPPPLISSLPHILTPSHPHSLTSSLPHILTTSHPHSPLIHVSSVTSSLPHIHILPSHPHSQYLISSLPHILLPHILTTSNPPSYSHPSPSHPPLILSLHLILATSPHIFSSSDTPSHPPLISSLPHILPSSSLPHILTPSHPNYLTSSLRTLYIYITSSYMYNVHVRTSNPLLIHVQCILALSHPPLISSHPHCLTSLLAHYRFTSSSLPHILPSYPRVTISHSQDHYLTYSPHILTPSHPHYIYFTLTSSPHISHPHILPLTSHTLSYPQILTPSLPHI